MGVTIEDMLIRSRDKYKMKMIAGKNGWANSISWLLMAEDTTIINNFKGKELVVTTGVGFKTKEKLEDLVRILDRHHSAGLIINTGYYIREVPEEVIACADECDLPLLTVPWDIEMSEMIKDLTVQIFLQSQTDEQTSRAFIRAIEDPEQESSYRDTISAVFDTDGRFQVVAFTADDLDSMDTMERKRIGYRLQIYLENISHNAHFFYYDGCFLLIFNAIEDAVRDEIISGFLHRAEIRMPDRKIYVGMGSPVNDVSNVCTSYRRAVFAVRFARRHGTAFEKFDELKLNRLLYAVSDRMLLKEMGQDLLRPVIEHDGKHHSDLTETLFTYLKCNGSIAAVSEAMYIHKNTILYRMAKIRELLNCDLDDGETRAACFIALMIWNYEKEKDA